MAATLRSFIGIAAILDRHALHFAQRAIKRVEVSADVARELLNRDAVDLQLALKARKRLLKLLLRDELGLNGRRALSPLRNFVDLVVERDAGEGATDQQPEEDYRIGRIEPRKGRGISGSKQERKHSRHRATNDS